MKLLTLMIFIIFTLQVKAQTAHELNFKEPIMLQKVQMKNKLPKIKMANSR